MSQRIIFALILILVAGAALAKPRQKLVDCRATRVFDSSIFEEGLSVYEYPNFDIEQVEGGLVVDMGCIRDFDTREGATVTLSKNDYNELLVHFSFAKEEDDEAEPIRFQFTSHSTWDVNDEGEDIEGYHGVVLYLDDAGLWRPLASFDCGKAL
ncbi:MAG: hypothetical protein A2284_09800 [Deltaproteobacteria bacterium RIFOXYA12_FULL_61_11]|nr:MAG: hypothetical protein A2284_09800 [Deltaproteobacteria bacterium RIFOXYA12_FULL_61_11]